MKLPTNFQHISAELIHLETQHLPRPCRKRRVGKTNNSKLNWQSQFETLERLVVDGKHVQCRQYFEDKISVRDIPRDWINPFVELAYRVQLPLFVLKALHPYIYPENSFTTPASDREKINYASALYTLGVSEESLALLKTVNFESEPEGLFHTAGAYIANWNYAEAIPYFQRYIAAHGISDYRKLVGELNCIPGYIFSAQWPEAQSLLAKVMSQCKEKNYRMLYGNCLELKAQIDFFHGNYDDCLASAAESISILSEQAGHYFLYAEKWQSICKCFRYRDESSLAELRQVKQKAFAARHWNTVRECDLFEAILAKDENLVRKVIMGTPSEFYRQRVRRLFETSIAAKGAYHLQLGENLPDSKPDLIFDPSLKTGQQREALFKKPRLYALFLALTEDFYQPSSIGFLFQRIYEDEKYNPDTSPPRVLQLLKRLNSWFADNQLPLQIRFKKSEFALMTTEPIQIKISRNTSLSASEAKMQEFRAAMKSKMFSTQDVCDTLHISKMSANRLIRAALQNGILQKENSRVGRPYLFTNKKKMVAA